MAGVDPSLFASNPSMKVAILSRSDLSGGAARAAFRLHESLLCSGAEARMFVQTQTGDHSTVFAPKTTPEKISASMDPHLDRIPLYGYPSRDQSLFSPGWWGGRHWLRALREFEPDVVHLHWINGGFVSPRQLARIRKPVVWSLHDMWAISGGCHYSAGCTAFESSCGRCPMLRSNSPRDLSRKGWRRKQAAYKGIENLTIVGLSSWLAREAQKSALLAGRAVVNLPNPIDTNVFRPINRASARSLFNIPQHSRVLLFGAMSATSSPRKGYDLLRSALEQITTPDVSLVVFGASHGDSDSFAGLPINYVGSLGDDVALTALYSAGDATVVPSREENLSNVIMESASCGTPVIAYQIGGNGDMIDHKVNGYLASSLDARGLAAGIDWVFKDEARRLELGDAARAKAVDEFDYPIVAARYLQLYGDVIRADTETRGQ
jgi:glycosyltransferase involved in cell wall biosynthesis